MGETRRRSNDFHLRTCSPNSSFNNHHIFLTQGLSFFRKVHDMSPSNYTHFLNYFWSYASGSNDNVEFQSAISSLIGDNLSLMSDFTLFMSNADETITAFSKGKEKIGIQKRDSQLNGTNPKSEDLECESESVRQLTGGKPKSEGLNDERTASVSVSEPEREEEPQPRRRKKQRRLSEEERRSRWEDAMYESDMCIIWFKSAISFAEKVISGIEEMEIQGMSRVHFFKCLEQLYGDYTDEIFKLWNNNPVSVSTSVLARLQQRLEDFYDFNRKLQL